MTQAKTPKQPQYDLDKAMASDAARRIIKRVLHLGYKVDYQAEGLAHELRAAARVPSVEEAAIALAEFACAKPDTERNDLYDRALGCGAAHRLYRERAERLVQDYRDAKAHAREAAEKETK